MHSLSGKLQEVIEEINSIREDVLNFRSQKTSHGTAMLDKFKLVWSGVKKSERARTNVAVLIRKNLIKDIKYISEKLDLRIYSRDDF